MALPSSGTLRFSQIEQEFGQTSSRKFGEYRISKEIGDMTRIPLDEGIGRPEDDNTENSIRFSQFRGSRLNVIVHYSANETRAIGGWNKYTNDPSSVTVIGPEGAEMPKPQNGRGAKVTLHVSDTLLSNKEPGSESGEHRERCALRSGNPEYWDESVILHMNIGHEAVVSGTGGSGGSGGDPDDGNVGRGEDGENGSSAIGIATPVEKIIIQEGAVVQAGGGGGGGGGGVSSDSGSIIGPSGGGGSGLPAGGSNASPAPAAAGGVLTFSVRSSAPFVDSEGNLDVTGGQPEKDEGGEGAFLSGSVGYRVGDFGWSSLQDAPITNTYTMVDSSGNNTNAQMNITFQVHQRAKNIGTNNFGTKITINSIVNRGKNFEVGDDLSTSEWNAVEEASERIIQVESVTTTGGGSNGNIGSNNGKGAGDGGDGDSIDTGSGGGVATGGGGGGGSPYGGNFVGAGGERGIKEQDNAVDGGNGSTEKGGDGGKADAEGGDPHIEGRGGKGGDNGYGLVLKNGLKKKDITIIGSFVGRTLEGGSDILI